MIASPLNRTGKAKIHQDPELGDEEFNACQLLCKYLQDKSFLLTCEAAGLKTSFLPKFSNKSDRRVGIASKYNALLGMDEDLVLGTIVLFGTPAEEMINVKINMVKVGLIKDNVDCALMLHPMAQDVMYRGMLAMDNVEIEYFHKPAHASMASWKGVYALDAIRQINNSLYRGGKAPNIIPFYVSASYRVRSRDKIQLGNLKFQVKHYVNAAG
ncbi:hypothetical protein BD408DRAFT_431547 [Parasitella parasitica]|nr:hypothetical protein BD408DRAFT_431547 [Parasitella parasitica]